MAILSGDVKLLKSAVMADVPEGGGAPTGNVIADGVSNAIFPDISELDRAGGRVNMRKVHVSIQTDDTDTYFGGNVIVAEPPEDPRVSVTMFTTESAFDKRIQAQSRVEAYLNKGPTWPGYLYENHIEGQRIIQLFQQKDSTLPVVGQTLVLIQNEGLGTQIEQYVRATEVTYAEQTFYYSNGGAPVAYKAWIVSIELSDALRNDMTGSPPSPFYTKASNGTLVRDTVVADAATYVGVVPLRAAADLGDFTVNATGVYTQLVPSAQTETPLTDVNPMQQSVGYMASGGVLTMSLSMVFTTTQSMFIGGCILPGSLTIVRSGITLTDTGGIVYNGGSEVGQVDYENGVVTLSSNVFGTSSGAHTVTYTPASVPNTFGPSTHFDVTAENRSLSYVRTLETVPAPGSLSISFQVSKRWYVLRDNGTGSIKGISSTDGAGTVNYETGTVLVTLGALPDVDSIILYQWTPGYALSTLVQAELANGGKAAATLTFPMAVKPETLSLSWNDGTARTATCNSGGVLQGTAATGTLSGNVLKFAPNLIPAAGVTVTATYTGYTTVVDPASTSLTGVDAGSNWTFTIPDTPASPYGCQFDVLVQQNTVRIGGVWQSNTQSRLMGIVLQGSVAYVNLNNTNAGIYTTAGTVDWVAKTFTIPKSLLAIATYFDYGDTAGVLYQNAVTTPGVPHTVPQTLPILNGIVTYSQVEVPGQTTVFTPTAYALETLAPASANTLLLNSTFRLGGVEYRQGLVGAQIGTLYGSISPTTGSGTAVGTVAEKGPITLTTWTANTTNTVTAFSAVWAPPQPGVGSPYYIKKIAFRSATAPLRPSSVSVSAKNAAGTTLTGTTNEDGEIVGGITGLIDYENGVIKLSGNVTLDAATLRYNGVSFSYLPLDADIIGLDPVRLPSDGRVPIFRSGGFAVVGHTGEITATVSNGQTIDCSRVRLSRVRVVGNNGVVINTGYTANLEAGTVSFTDVTGYSQPVTIQHRIEDMAVVRDAQINGDITFTRPLTHNYPLGSFVSSALIAGDLFSRVSLLFDQASWNGTWSDAVVGSAATPTFNSTQYPIAVTNRGALTERWIIQFTNSTSFNVIGENVGVIATGNTSTNCAPNNPATGVPYFTIPAAGWGSGWATGNILRFNTIAAGFPVWVVRTIQQGPETVVDDDFTLLIRGDVNAP